MIATYLSISFLTVGLIAANPCDFLNSVFLAPCTCRSNGLFCTDIINVDQTFEYISDALPDDEKAFQLLSITNSKQLELKENAFRDITFVNIDITAGTAIIHPYSFTATSLTVLQFNLISSIDLDPDSEKNLFYALSSMVNLRSVNVATNDLLSIPTRGFLPLNGVARNLSTIVITGTGKLNLANFQFYDIPNLEFIYFTTKQIDYIPRHAFDFRKKSDTFLNVYLGLNKLNDTSIEPGAFFNSQRPVILDISYNRLTFLNEAVFSPFFKADVRNRVNIFNTILDCDCRSLWLIEQREDLEDRVISGRCKDGRPLFNRTVDEFENCY